MNKTFQKLINPFILERLFVRTVTNVPNIQYEKSVIKRLASASHADS